MTKFSTPIDLPQYSPVRQKHGLFSSAYHLVHPDNDSPREGNEDPISLWPQPFESSCCDPCQETDGSPTSIEITCSDGTSVGQRIRAGVSWMEPCCSDLGCHFQCQPGYDCSADVEPEDMKPINKGAEESCYVPSYITSRVQCSTFGHAATDYWGMAERNLRNGREKAIEERLWHGDCVLDEDGNPANPYFCGLDPVEPDAGECLPNQVTVLGEGCAQPCDKALSMLNCALAECGCGAAGMIHAPTPVIECMCMNGCLDEQNVDYGDGMGCRSILTTKVRGNIVVAGSGYGGEGPIGAAELAPNQAWIFATSMVYLMWDKIEFTPERQDFTNAVNFPTNTVDVVAEQVVGAFFNPCCNYAVLVDLCPEC